MFLVEWARSGLMGRSGRWLGWRNSLTIPKGALLRGVLNAAGPAWGVGRASSPLRCCEGIMHESRVLTAEGKIRQTNEEFSRAARKQCGWLDVCLPVISVI